jgi:hypothetical protein
MKSEPLPDFKAVSEGLLKLVPKRRKSIADTLDKIRDQLIEARLKGASYRTLARFLGENGIQVSDFTVRSYLNAQGGGGRRRRKKAPTRTRPPTITDTAGASPRPSWKKPSQPEEARKLPPRLAHRRKYL